MDGYYFLTLQVTLCEKSPKKEKVMLTINGEVKLEGWIDQNTNSTGVLSRAMELSAGGILKVTITSPKLCINTNESVTHMGIIFITKHWCGSYFLVSLACSGQPSMSGASVPCKSAVMQTRLGPSKDSFETEQSWYSTYGSAEHLTA